LQGWRFKAREAHDAFTAVDQIAGKQPLSLAGSAVQCLSKKRK
jgi:hypothetical protein